MPRLRSRPSASGSGPWHHGGVTPDPKPSTPAPRGDSHVLLRALLIKLAFGALLVAAAAHWPSDSPYLAPREGDASTAVWVLSRGFDAHAYQKLALHGYTDAFSRNYPLGYPLLIRGAHALVGNAQTAAVLASNAAALLAALLFAAIARIYARRHRARGLWGGERVGPALLLFLCMPGWLVFGTVAYSEGLYLAVALGAWYCLLRAEPEPGNAVNASDARSAPRHLGWLSACAVLAAASVMVRHAGAALLLALALVEGLRVLRAPASARRRALTEALLLCWTAIPVAAYFIWKYTAHDLAGLQQDIWRMGFSPLGGLASLLSEGATPEYVAQIYATLPVVIWLLFRARAVDARLTVLGLISLLLLLSYTGTAAQSLMRYMWTLWPAALGVLSLRDRGLVLALAAMLFCLSLMMGMGHVLGTAAL